MKKRIVILFFVEMLLSGCYRDVEELLYPQNGACNTSGVTYSGTVVPLLQSHGCLGCHNGAAPSGNISLQGYNNIKAVVQSGKLYGAISHAPGFSPMPQGGNKMSACNISKIKAWIEAGFPNN
jgi:hypothetical protein